MFAFKLSSGPAAPQAGASEAAIPAVSRVLGPVSALASRFYNWRMRNAAYDGLMSMDDRLLRDIGLSRAEIEAAVDGQIRR